MPRSLLFSTPRRVDVCISLSEIRPMRGRYAEYRDNTESQGLSI